MKEHWPRLPLAEWQETYATLHMWTQIVGKIRLVQTPWVNHSWHVTLYPTARGLTTSPVPSPAGIFQIDFDFVGHRLLVRKSDGEGGELRLQPMTVAAFYGELFTLLEDLGITVRIVKRPNEVTDPIPFDEDTSHGAYDGDAANRCWRIMLQTSRVFQKFRARFLGKCSPVHFFWGAFDLAVTRFSGRSAPEHPGGFPNLPDWVTREAYSHEVSSAGFWPGGGPVTEPVYYAYAYPEPAGFREAVVKPGAAAFHAGLREFLLPYEAVRQAPSPDDALLEFLQSTYEAAADLAGWDREALERKGEPGPEDGR